MKYPAVQWNYFENGCKYNFFNHWFWNQHQKCYLNVVRTQNQSLALLSSIFVPLCILCWDESIIWQSEMENVGSQLQTWWSSKQTRIILNSVKCTMPTSWACDIEFSSLCIFWSIFREDTSIVYQSETKTWVLNYKIAKCGKLIHTRTPPSFVKTVTYYTFHWPMALDCPLLLCLLMHFISKHISRPHQS